MEEGTWDRSRVGELVNVTMIMIQDMNMINGKMKEIGYDCLGGNNLKSF